MTRRLLLSTRAMAAVLWLVAGAALAAATAVDVWAWMSVPPTPPEVVSDVTVRHARDDQGRRASFRILLFSDEFRWRLNSYAEVEDGSANPDFTHEMKAVLDSAEEIICVGASSEEIPQGVSFRQGRAQEEWRAARRAERIATWVRSAVSRPVPVRKLNVGHHARTEKGRDTSDQRRVIIILVLEHEEGADLDQSLRTAMMGESQRTPIFDTLLTKYSLGSGEAFTWVP